MCLSSHSVRETLQDPCCWDFPLYLFTAHERAGSRGSKLISSGIPPNSIVVVINVKTSLMAAGLMQCKATTTKNKFAHFLFIYRATTFTFSQFSHLPSINTLYSLLTDRTQIHCCRNISCNKYQNSFMIHHELDRKMALYPKTISYLKMRHTIPVKKIYIYIFYI